MKYGASIGWEEGEEGRMCEDKNWGKKVEKRGVRAYRRAAQSEYNRLARVWG